MADPTKDASRRPAGSITMPGAEPRRESQEELRALELGQPFGERGVHQVGVRGDEPRRAARPELVGRELPVDREGPLAVPGDFGPILAEEDDYRDAVAA